MGSVLNDTLSDVEDATDDAKQPLGAVKKVPTAADLDKLTPAQKEAEIAQQRKDAAQVEKDKKEPSLKINIKLDLDVEIHLTARVKGDITIGLL